MKLTVEELRTLQLALIKESGLTESGIAKMQSLSNKLEGEVQRLTKRALDLPSAQCPKCHNFGGTHFSLCPLANKPLTQTVVRRSATGKERQPPR